MNNIDLSNVQENSIVVHKKFGECIVKKFKADYIVTYVKSKHREMIFEFPKAFYDGYLITTDHKDHKSIELTKEEVEISKIKVNKLSTDIYYKKENYLYLAVGIIGKSVQKRDGSLGIIIDYISNGYNKEGYLVVSSNNVESKYLYPSCFVKKYLSFTCNEDIELAKKDIDTYNTNDKKVIAKEKAMFEKNISLINDLSENLSCVKKCESVEEFCRLYRGAINHEIQYLKKQGTKRYKLTNGVEITNIGDDFIYLYETETELSLLADFNINIFLDGYDIIYGKVISCEDNTIMFSSTKLNSEFLKELSISFDAWFIMENLDKRLDKLSFSYNSIVEELVCGKVKISANSQLQFGQEKAIEMACSRPISFIWGPPGTGKTYTLANVVKNFLNEGKRVLMMSYSNVSVDGAILEVAEHCNNYPIGNLIRYGYPKDKQLVDNENLLSSYNVALCKNIEMKKRQKELVNKKANVEKSTTEYKEIQEELKNIRIKIKNDEEEIVKNANFVATTLSKAVCDKLIYKQNFDAVIIDEVSMAYTPQIIFAANLAMSHFCCIGDFNQLPPIVQNDNEKSILNSDVFEYCGDINNMTVLDTQRRTHKNIANFISANMYFGLLKSHESTDNRSVISEREPFCGKPITYVDIHNLKSSAIEVGTSHANVISALVTARIAEKSVEDNEFSVGIITPYNEQAKLINAILSSFVNCENKDRITCATVHQFQGSQRDIIIYDATDAKGGITHPGSLLVSNKHNISNRLFNVAMTRAKGKFIVVADRLFVDSGLTKGKTEKTKDNKSLFCSLSQLCYYSNYIVDVLDLDFISNYEPLKNFISFYANKTSFNLYIRDIECAKYKVRFDISGKITTSQFQDKYYKLIDTLEKKRIETTAFIDLYSNTNENYSTYAKKKAFTLFDMTIIDDDIVWIGDPLKKNSLCWRINSKNVVAKLKNLL